MTYETIKTETERTRYVEEPTINPDGTATRDISLVGWLIAGVCVIAIGAISIDIILSAF